MNTKVGFDKVCWMSQKWLIAISFCCFGRSTCWCISYSIEHHILLTVDRLGRCFRSVYIYACVCFCVATVSRWIKIYIFYFRPRALPLRNRGVHSHPTRIGGALHCFCPRRQEPQWRHWRAVHHAAIREKEGTTDEAIYPSCSSSSSGGGGGSYSRFVEQINLPSSASQPSD